MLVHDFALRGKQLRPEHFAVVSDKDILGSMLRVLREVGLRGRALRRRRWRDITKLSHAFPLMGMMKDGRWVVVVKSTKTEEGPASTC